MKQLYIKLGTRAKSSLNRDFYVLFSTFFPNQAEIMIWMENWWFENGSPIFQYGAYVRIIKTLWSHIKYFFIRETFDQYVVEEITINTLTPTKAIRINKGQLIWSRKYVNSKLFIWTKKPTQMFLYSCPSL